MPKVNMVEVAQVATSILVSLPLWFAVTTTRRFRMTKAYTLQRSHEWYIAKSQSHEIAKCRHNPAGSGRNHVSTGTASLESRIHDESHIEA